LSALAGSFLFTAGLLAQTPHGGLEATNGVPRVQVTLQPGETIGHEQVMRELLRSGTNEYLFVVPDGTRSEAEPDGRLVLSRWEKRYYVSIRVLALPPAPSQLQEALRQRMTSQFPQASKLEEFETAAADHQARGVQFQVEQPGAGTHLIRAVCVPFPTELLEVILNADTSSARVGQQALDQVLLTLRSNEQGKLEIIRRSAKS
jgi:hypothetical protein